MTLYHLLKRLLESRDAAKKILLEKVDATEVDLEAIEAFESVYDKYIIEECKDIVAAYECGDWRKGDCNEKDISPPIET